MSALQHLFLPCLLCRPVSTGCNVLFAPWRQLLALCKRYSFTFNQGIRHEYYGHFLSKEATRNQGKDMGQRWVCDVKNDPLFQMKTVEYNSEMDGRRWRLYFLYFLIHPSTPVSFAQRWSQSRKRTFRSWCMFLRTCGQNPICQVGFSELRCWGRVPFKSEPGTFSRQLFYVNHVRKLPQTRVKV